MHWAYTQGMAGVNYRQTRGKAADAGTLTHILAENWFRGDPQPLALAADPEVKRKAYTSFRAFLAWAKGVRLRPAVIDGQPQVEIRMVSERYRFGGMADAAQIGTDNSLHLMDWKTSNGVYIEYLMQIAAYGQLWNEHFPDKPIDGGYFILRFSREYGDFTASWFGELEDAWQAFLAARRLYEFTAKVKARCR